MSSSSKDRRIALKVEALEDRLVPDAAGFVQGLYQDVLHRAAPAADVQYWTTQMQNGMPASGAHDSHTRSLRLMVCADWRCAFITAAFSTRPLSSLTL